MKTLVEEPEKVTTSGSPSPSYVDNIKVDLRPRFQSVQSIHLFQIQAGCERL